jgi:hypothetical protein
MSYYVVRGRVTSRRIYPPQFRPPFNRPRAPIHGGRWFVRKVLSNNENVWRAWTQGKNKVHNKRFETFEEAIKWAQAHAGVSS